MAWSAVLGLLKPLNPLLVIPVGSRTKGLDGVKSDIDCAVVLREEQRVQRADVSYAAQRAFETDPLVAAFVCGKLGPTYMEEEKARVEEAVKAKARGNSGKAASKAGKAGKAGEFISFHFRCKNRYVCSRVI